MIMSRSRTTKEPIATATTIAPIAFEPIPEIVADPASYLEAVKKMVLLIQQMSAPAVGMLSKTKAELGSIATANFDTFEAAEGAFSEAADAAKALSEVFTTVSMRMLIGASAAALEAGYVPSKEAGSRHAIASSDDPVFAAIEAHRKLLKECDQLYGDLDEVEIGRAKKKRMRHSAAELASLQTKYERTRRAETAAGMRMAKTKPTTPAGAGALVAYVRADLEIGVGPEWHLVALATAAKALAGM